MSCLEDESCLEKDEDEPLAAEELELELLAIAFDRRENASELVAIEDWLKTLFDDGISASADKASDTYVGLCGGAAAAIINALSLFCIAFWE